MTGATWFTSDLHFGHAYVSAWRGFGTSREDADTEAHDAAIVERWVKRVKPEDTIWVLGDIVGKYQQTEYALDLLKTLPGTKHLIAGNHDSVSPIHREAWKHQRLYLEAFESVQAYARIRVCGEDILLSHFPYLGTGADHTADVRYPQFRLPDEGTILLHGHTHSKGKFHVSDAETLQIHVGLDAWELAPVHLVVIDLLVAHWSGKTYSKFVVAPDVSELMAE
jgi:calcineurin-like phosphoesterase family protein